MDKTLSRFLRIALYVILVGTALLFILPVYVMVVNSLKPLDEIRSGNLMSLPVEWTLDRKSVV